jgi:methionyl-tRNA formyltransferase
MGTPEFAVASLKALHESGCYIAAVVTVPDRPAGRGRKLTFSPVKEYALENRLNLLQPEKLRDPEFIAELKDLNAEIFAVVAFRMLPEAVWTIPPKGTFNLHASLLPRWRGAAPIQAAILAGDPVTGITIMQMDAGLDTGPLLAQREIAIGAEETAGELESRLAQLGADLLLELLPAYLNGQLIPQPQPTEGVTLAPRLSKTAPAIAWERSAQEVAGQVRAFAPEPGAYTFWNGTLLKILAARVLADADLPPAQPGTVFAWQGLPAVHAGAGALVLLQVQMAGKRPMNGEVFLRGQRAWMGAVLSSRGPGE